MNIFKTFETYLKEPLSILRDNFIRGGARRTEADPFQNRRGDRRRTVRAFERGVQRDILAHDRARGDDSLRNGDISGGLHRGIPRTPRLRKA